MFRIKICGITTPEDALLAADAGADAIGLNFYEKSSRAVTPDQAANIVRRLRTDFTAAQVQVFGVFVNASLDDILWTIRVGDLYPPDRAFGIQLHGEEPPEFLRDLYREGIGPHGTLFQILEYVPTLPIVRAFRCRANDLVEPAKYLETCNESGSPPQAVLLDAYSANAYGGTGQTLDWASIPAQRDKFLGLPLILAGGLTPENVAQAIATARPDAVDVASGVESSPGKKDPAKVRAFIAAAKSAFAALDKDRS